MKYLLNHPLLMVFVLVIMTFILYIGFYFFAYYTCDFANPGLFGDFIGGVIGTILTAVAAVFVYNTYKSQLIQIEIQRQEYELSKKEVDQNLISGLYDKISKDIDELVVTFKEPGTLEFQTHSGIYVFYNFSTLIKYDNNVLNQLSSILVSFEYLVELTKSAKFRWKLQSQLNKDRNYLMFYSKVLWPLHQFYRMEWPKHNSHPDTPIIKPRFEKLAKESLNYLLERNLIGKPSDDVYIDFINK